MKKTQQETVRDAARDSERQNKRQRHTHGVIKERKRADVIGCIC